MHSICSYGAFIYFLILEIHRPLLKLRFSGYKFLIFSVSVFLCFYTLMHSHTMLNSVRYAPAVGDSCLDLQEFFSREEAYEDSGRDPNELDEDGPYIPESDYYHVVSIIQGTCNNIMCVVLRGGGMNGRNLYLYPSVNTIS